MYDEERGLLDAVAEQPDADHDRRVYADWLEDHGDPSRAEFVRLQLALARLPDDHPDRAALLTRERGLLFRREQGWTLGLRHLVSGWTFRRGFVDEVTIENPPRSLTAADFDEIFRWPFVRRLSAPRQAWRLFPGLAESPEARRLRELHVANFLEPSHARDLIECPHFERLGRLEMVDCNLSAPTLRRLARSEVLGRLDTLILSGNRFGTEGAVALTRSPRVGGLRHLDLSRCDLDGDAALAIASAPLLGGLTTLRLAGGEFNPDALAGLLRGPHLRQLTDLDLSYNASNFPDGWHGLLDPGGPPALARLALAHVPLYRSQVFDLISSPRLAGLRQLDLREVWIEDDGSSWTGPAEPPVGPLTLDIGGLLAAHTMAEELLTLVPAMSRVRRLRLSRLGDDTVHALFTSPHLGNLRHLDVSESRGMTRAMLTRLLGSNLAARLTGLDLSTCDLSDIDIEELANEHPNLANLTWLSLRSNHVGSRGARALAASPYLRDLRHLDLADNDIDDEGAVALARVEHLASPVVLDVSGNDIGSPGMAALLGAAERAFSRGVTIPPFEGP